MKFQGTHYRTIWLKENDNKTIQIIDQRFLPHNFVIEDIKTVDELAIAIKEMHLRGAGLIGVAAAYGMYLAVIEAKARQNPEEHIKSSAENLLSTRPTAVNLKWAVDRQLSEMQKNSSISEKISAAFETAEKIAQEDMEVSRKIGEHGLKLIEEISKRKKGKPVSIMTHCNAGWLAFVDYGTATSPIYFANEKGIKVHVLVSETRPRNQGSSLTAWEMEQEKIPYQIIADNAAGHLMQHGMVDLVIVGTDRVTLAGDVANKIGTYMKALAAKDNNVPFYVALPSSSIDWNIKDGIKEIPIEEREEDEIKYISGLDSNGKLAKILLTPKPSHALNYGFDVTPSRLISGLITERGICRPDRESILGLFPEHRK